MTAKGMVYVLRAAGSPRYKIGWTVDLVMRIQALKTGCPYPIEVVAQIPSDDPAIEREVHKMFGHLRVHGEWFELTDSAVDFLMYAQERDITAVIAADALIRLSPYLSSASKVDKVRRLGIGVLDGSGA